MSSRVVNKSKGGMDSEIYRCRDESNWRKLLELAENLRQRAASAVGQCTSSSTSVHLANLLIGEAKLEMYLEENPPVDANIAKARTSLSDAKRYLTECTRSEAEKSNVATDARFLLAKCCYAQGQYEQALVHLDQGGIERLEERPLGARMLKILAESFAVKGLCLEQQAKSSLVKKSVIIKFYVQAGEMGLKYLQVVEKSQGLQGAVVQLPPSGMLPVGNSLASGLVGGGSCSTEFRIGILLETALQRAPILMMKAGRIREAVDQYRMVLRAQETSSTQSLRMTLARQLAEVLLRGISEHEWQQIPPRLQLTSEKIGVSGSTGKYWRPQMYTGASLYVPGEHIEEILLLLSLSDAIAVRNVVLDRSTDVAADRTQSVKNVTAVLDLFSIALARNAQFGLLCEHFEKVAKFSSDEYHIWNQFGLCLISAGIYSRGVKMLIESAKLRPEFGFDLLMAARVTLVNMCDAVKALELVEEAIVREKRLAATITATTESDILAVCYTLKGLCHEALADAAPSKQAKQDQRVEAFKALIDARQTDPDYAQAEYLLGVHYANVHQIDAAMACAKRALGLAPDFFPAIQLLIVLLSAQKRHDEAVELLKLSLEEYPNNLNLLYLKVHLDDYLDGPQQALRTAGEMLRQWRVMYEKYYVRLRQATAGVTNNNGTSGNMLPLVGAAYSQLGAATQSQATTAAHSVHGHSGRGSVVGSGGNWPTITSGLLSLWPPDMEGSTSAAVGNRFDRSFSETLAQLAPGSYGAPCNGCSSNVQSANIVHGRLSEVNENTLVQVQMHIWLLLARLYIKLAHYREADESLSEAAAVLPLSPHVLLVRGMLHAARGELFAARDSLEGSLAIQPRNAFGLRQLAAVYQQLGSHQLAEATLQNAALLEPMSPATWLQLGRVLHDSTIINGFGSGSYGGSCTGTGTPLEASECFEMAVQIELFAPLIDFGKLPRSL